jgi:hypothetical protein
MQTIFLISSFILPLLAFGQQPFERKGFIFGTAFGGGAIALSSDLIGEDAQFGGTFPNLKSGAMVSPKTAVVLLLPGTVYRYKWGERERDRGFEGFFPSVQYWVKDRWWLLGGTGLGMDAPAFYDIKDASERKFYFGPAAVVGTGYELWRRGRFALDLQGRAQFGSIATPEGQRKGMAFSLLVGVNWY